MRSSLCLGGLLLFAPVSAQAVGVTLAWDANPETNLAGYRLYYDTDSIDPPYEGSFADQGPSPIDIPLASLPDLSQPSVTLSGIPACTHMFFAVTAYDANGLESDYSVPIEATIAPKPDPVLAIPGTQEGALDLSWTPIDPTDTGTVTGFELAYDLDLLDPLDGIGAQEGDSPILLPPTSAIFTLSGLQGGAQVRVKLTSVCPDGETRGSLVVTGTTALPLCGNGLLETGEICETGSCPSSCDDGVACTTDILRGSAADCDASCSFELVDQCTDGDGCCPSGCDSALDDDCSPSCGNGSLDPGETCDPPSSCPTSCDDGDACTEDLLSGSPSGCSAACTHPRITACQDGDGCCPPGCDSSSDDDCSASCGNGTIDPNETCDPASTCPRACDDGDACTTDTLSGSASNCNASCSAVAISSCSDGDGCCPAGCDQSTDADCSGGGDPSDPDPDPDPDPGPTLETPKIAQIDGGCTHSDPSNASPTDLGLTFLLAWVLLLRKRAAN